jgi:hypothetical protein
MLKRNIKAVEKYVKNINVKDLKMLFSGSDNKITLTNGQSFIKLNECDISFDYEMIINQSINDGFYIDIKDNFNKHFIKDKAETYTFEEIEQFAILSKEKPISKNNMLIDFRMVFEAVKCFTNKTVKIYYSNRKINNILFLSGEYGEAIVSTIK